MKRHHLVILLVGFVVLVLAAMLLIGVVRGDDTDLEKRQEDSLGRVVGR